MGMRASRCQPLFLVFGRLVMYRTVAKSRSESGYKISGRRKHGRDFLARERGRQSNRTLAPRRSAKEIPAVVWRLIPVQTLTLTESDR
jgi:hypothetical protein